MSVVRKVVRSAQRRMLKFCPQTLANAKSAEKVIYSSSVNLLTSRPAFTTDEDLDENAPGPNQDIVQ